MIIWLSFGQYRSGVEEDGVVKVSIIGSVSKGLEGKQLSEMGDLSAAGAVAFSDDGHYVENANFMRRAMEYAGQLGKMIIDHAEDMTMCSDGFMNEGIISYQMGVAGRPAVGKISRCRGICSFHS